jgi:hypothetical protein
MRRGTGKARGVGKSLHVRRGIEGEGDGMGVQGCEGSGERAIEGNICGEMAWDVTGVRQKDYGISTVNNNWLLEYRGLLKG